MKESPPSIGKSRSRWVLTDENGRPIWAPEPKETEEVDGPKVLDINGVEIKEGDWIQTIDCDGMAWIAPVIKIEPAVMDQFGRFRYKKYDLVMNSNYKIWLWPRDGHRYEVLPKDWIEGID